ncbi:hypothetical protein ACFRDV_13990 [Streptomyces fagopyri]|uniref:hypothetical protein n=1 Tax=Streptomyces fagopyri TaxID=2662397 RepID=UPI0036A5ECB7
MSGARLARSHDDATRRHGPGGAHPRDRADRLDATRPRPLHAGPWHSFRHPPTGTHLLRTRVLDLPSSARHLLGGVA